MLVFFKSLIFLLDFNLFADFSLCTNYFEFIILNLFACVFVIMKIFCELSFIEMKRVLYLFNFIIII